MEPGTRDIYENPADYIVPINKRRLPHVRVRGSRSEQLSLFPKLDAGFRISLIDAETECEHEDNGAFSVFKDLLRDRLILDGRRPNMRELAISRWVQTMACIHTLLFMFLPHDRILAIYAKDLKTSITNF